MAAAPPLYLGMAYTLVHSLAVLMAACSSSFQVFATSAASGSSGFGAPSRAWMESKIVRICRAGDQLSATVQWSVWAPFPGCARGLATLQHVEADAPQLVDVRVEDLGQEPDLGRRHGIIVW